MTSRQRLMNRLHPEIAAGGFASVDHRVTFFTRVQALLKPGDRVLDFGSGRGKWREVERGTPIEPITDIKRTAATLVAFDVDTVVEEHEEADEKVFAEIGATLPFEDASFDLIYSWAVFEHVADAEFYAGELDRVLKPGGWICAFTPNKWGYAGIMTRLIPNSLHARFLRVLSPHRKEVDVFPTTYRMNTMSVLRRLFPGYVHASYYFTGPPAYHANKMVLARLVNTYNALVPPRFQPTLHIFMHKPSG